MFGLNGINLTKKDMKSTSIRLPIYRHFPFRYLFCFGTKRQLTRSFRF